MKRIKSVISVVLALLIVCSVFTAAPLTVFADDGNALVLKMGETITVTPPWGNYGYYPYTAEKDGIVSVLIEGSDISACICDSNKKQMKNDYYGDSVYLNFAAKAGETYYVGVQSFGSCDITLSEPKTMNPGESKSIGGSVKNTLYSYTPNKDMVVKLYSTSEDNVEKNLYLYDSEMNQIRYVESYYNDDNNFNTLVSLKKGEPLLFSAEIEYGEGDAELHMDEIPSLELGKDYPISFTEDDNEPHAFALKVSDTTPVRFTTKNSTTAEVTVYENLESASDFSGADWKVGDGDVNRTEMIKGSTTYIVYVSNTSDSVFENISFRADAINDVLKIGEEHRFSGLYHGVGTGCARFTPAREMVVEVSSSEFPSGGSDPLTVYDSELNEQHCYSWQIYHFDAGETYYFSLSDNDDDGEGTLTLTELTVNELNIGKNTNVDISDGEWHILHYRAGSDAPVAFSYYGNPRYVILDSSLNKINDGNLMSYSRLRTNGSELIYEHLASFQPKADEDYYIAVCKHYTNDGNSFTIEEIPYRDMKLNQILSTYSGVKNNDVIYRFVADKTMMLDLEVIEPEGVIAQGKVEAYDENFGSIHKLSKYLIRKGDVIYLDAYANYDPEYAGDYPREFYLKEHSDYTLSAGETVRLVGDFSAKYTASENAVMRLSTNATGIGARVYNDNAQELDGITCNDCAFDEGRAVLIPVEKGKDYYIFGNLYHEDSISVKLEKYADMKQLTLGKTETVNIEEEGDKVFYYVIPEKDMTLTGYSAGGDYQDVIPEGELYYNNLKDGTNGRWSSYHSGDFSWERDVKAGDLCLVQCYFDEDSDMQTGSFDLTVENKYALTTDLTKTLSDINSGDKITLSYTPEKDIDVYLNVDNVYSNRSNLSTLTVTDSSGGVVLKTDSFEDYSSALSVKGGKEYSFVLDVKAASDSTLEILVSEIPELRENVTMNHNIDRFYKFVPEEDMFPVLTGDCDDVSFSVYDDSFERTNYNSQLKAGKTYYIYVDDSEVTEFTLKAAEKLTLGKTVTVSGDSCLYVLKSGSGDKLRIAVDGDDKEDIIYYISLYDSDGKEVYDRGWVKDFNVSISVEPLKSYTLKISLGGGEDFKLLAEEPKEFVIEGDTLKLYTGNSASPSIPSVKKIAVNAFNGNTDIETINIPDSVTEIGGSAFFDCSSLKTITFPDGVQKLEGSVCRRCFSLETAKLPKNLKEIGSYAFTSCMELKEINLPDGLTAIGEYAFAGPVNVKEVTVPRSVTTIGEGALGYGYGYKGENYKPIEGFVIKGYKGTAAEKYAKDNGFKFVDLEKKDILVGDANSDGIVDILDASMIQKYTVEKVTMNDDQKDAADVNNDGVVDILDASDIQKFTVEKITEFKKKA